MSDSDRIKHIGHSKIKGDTDHLLKEAVSEGFEIGAIFSFRIVNQDGKDVLETKLMVRHNEDGQMLESLKEAVDGNLKKYFRQ